MQTKRLDRTARHVDTNTDSIYDYGNNIADVQYLFQKMNGKINGRHPSPQIAHYMNTYHDVPLWVLITDLTLGETASMYRYLKGHCKTLVCNDFHHIGRNELCKMLIMTLPPLLGHAKRKAFSFFHSFA